MRYQALACLAAALIVAGCGGKPSARPVTDPLPERGERGRTERRRTAPQRAVGLDTPKGTAPSKPQTGAQSRSGARGPTGIHHTLRRGQTLYSLSMIYRVPVGTLMRVNGITDPSAIPAGTPILIPGVPDAPAEPGDRPGAGPEPAGPARASASILDLAWPLAGRITAPFGSRSKRAQHDGIDIDGLTGETVTAVAWGIVTRAGWDGRYGKVVVLDHGQGVTTLYAHASRLLVREGDVVAQGDPIAEVGRTGNARGTHLHFEMRRNGRPVDPLPSLRGGALPMGRPQQ